MNAAIRKRLPAYGRELIRMRKEGLAPDQRGVFITDDWRRWHDYGWRAVIQADAQLGLLNFSFVAGLEVIVMSKTAERAEQIGAAVACFNPRRLVAVSTHPPKINAMVSPPIA